MKSLFKYAPWFRTGKGTSNAEPLSYRSWKRLWQERYKTGWKSDLFERIRTTEWDLLIILDACRYDVLANIADCAVIDKAISPATATGKFLEKTRHEDLFEGVTYVSANPQSGKHDLGPIKEHIKIYEDSFDMKLSSVPPAAVYEPAREQVEEGEQVVAHTIQPHYPHICKIDGSIRPVVNGLHPNEIPEEYQNNVFQMQNILSRGYMDLESCRRSYRACAKFAWNEAREIAVRLSNNGYTVVITADHGELFGEWGFVEHPTDVAIRQLVEVPWIEFRPERTISAPTDQLSALGYVN